MHTITEVSHHDFLIIKSQAKEIKYDPHSTYFQARFYLRWYYYKIVDDE